MTFENPYRKAWGYTLENRETLRRKLRGFEEI